MTTAGTAYRCGDCGYVSLQWLGRCPECGEWNSFVEEAATVKAGKSKAKSRTPGITSGLPQPLKDVNSADTPRFKSGYEELDRVLGGGIVPGSLVLIGGEPGIGKSTLLLQLALKVAAAGETVLIASGEESEKQIRMRADRLGQAANGLYVAAETDIDRVIEAAEMLGPAVLIVDSIQTMSDAEISGGAGSLSQVKECTHRLLTAAKLSGAAVFIVGHVTKEGAIAGPRVLEHMVDTVLYFEGEQRQSHRIVRAVKNRFGSTDEIGVFDMGDAGLREVVNPSEVFIADRRQGAPGSVVVASIEGTRSFLVELQALAAPTSLAYPRRVAAGLDYQRLALLTAVLERRAGLKLGTQDIYVSAAGGLKIVEPAADLGIALAIASAFKDKPLAVETVVFGELGLNGEIRFVSQAERRIKEAARLGFRRAMVPPGAAKTKIKGIDIIEVSNVKDALSRLSGS
jgi:DNA repair protein RadA/Sms